MGQGWVFSTWNLPDGTKSGVGMSPVAIPTPDEIKAAGKALPLLIRPNLCLPPHSCWPQTPAAPLLPGWVASASADSTTHFIRTARESCC